MENKMKKDLGVLEAVFPMPVLMIATYNEDGTVNVMTAAWGQICDAKHFKDKGLYGGDSGPGAYGCSGLLRHSFRP